MTPPRWWQRDEHARRRPNLIARNRIKSAVRAWFEAGGYVEIEAGALQVSPGNETHLHALSASINNGETTSRLFLHTSPELAAKKLLAAGETKIFDFARVFRNRESGPLNVPEFTMLEWYREGARYEAVMEDTIALLRIAAETAGASRFQYRGAETDPFAEPNRIRVSEAFSRYADIDLGATLDDYGVGDRESLAATASSSGIRVAEDDTWSDVFSRVMAERIEPRLMSERPILLTDYPAPEAALARRRSDDPRFAERFELFACGVELANGFGELTDSAEQRRRFEAAMDEKERIYGERYPIDEDFLAALDEMPEAAGVALGFDRLVTLSVGADRVTDVLWTPPPSLDDEDR